MTNPTPITRAIDQPNRWLALVAASLGNFLGALDLTVNVALPAMTQHFATDMSLMQWIITFYVGTATALQLVVGRLADDHGLRRIYLCGIGVYTVAVLAVGLADRLELVFALRILQAVGYGMILATSAALVTQLFPDAGRGRALGLMTSITTGGAICATAAGGWLIDLFGWSSIFLARVPFGILALLLAAACLPRAQPTGGDRLNPAAGAALFCGLAGLVLALSLGGRVGWLHPLVGTLAGVGVLLLIVVIRIERGSSTPLIDVRLIVHRAIGPALATAVLLFGASFVNLFVLPYFVVNVIGASAATLGLLLTLAPLSQALSAPLAGALADRITAQWVVLAALLWTAAVMAGFASFDEHTGVLQVGLMLAAFGIGLGAFQASNTSIVMGNTPAQRLGSGAALLALATSLGMVTSVGTLSSLFSWLQQQAPSTLDDTARFAAAFSQLYVFSTSLILLAAALAAGAAWRARRPGGST